MGRRLTFMLLAFAALAVLAPAGALAAKKTTPKVTRVTPMRLKVGATLTIRGKNFSPRRTRNTVIFRSPGGRTAFVKPRRARRTKLVVKVPAAVTRLLSVKSGRQQATRFKLRVVTGRFGSYTVRRLSPVIVPVGGSAPRQLGGSSGGTAPGVGGPAVAPPCGSGSDWDNDLLSNSLEGQLHTDPCLADTDRDGMSDGWEYYSARDLNLKAVPYPGSRPWTNALDPSDADVDFDGDVLKAIEEYRAWLATGSSFIPAKASGSDDESPLGYSDGTQSSRTSEVPSAPVWHSADYGLTPPSQSFPALYDFDGNGLYTDDERDADRDGVNNYIESAQGPGRATWWAALWNSMTVKPWPETYYGDFSAQRPFGKLDLADPDVDGDGLLDGEDDEDFDGWSNVSEMYETIRDADGNGSTLTVDRGGSDFFVNAFNPCAPDDASRTCNRYKPF